MLAEKIMEYNTCKLQIYTLGRFGIFQKDKGFYSISGRSTKLWYLFKYLLLNRGKGIPPETILEDLYPDEEYENPKNTLQNIVYRLRKLLSQEEFFNNFGCNISYNNGCYSLCFNDDVFLDTDFFEEYINKAESLKHVKPDEAIEWYNIALKLYCGDYFPELIYEDWVIPKRNYYRRLYIQSALALVKLYQQKKEHDKCIKVCEQAIQIEPYEEELHISFIENLIGKGRITEAHNHYEVYTSMLYRQFGIKPTTELQQIYKLLKKSGAELNGSELAENYPPDENSTGAFYCDRNIFNSIYILERRRSERTGHIVFVVSITVNENPGTFSDFRKSLVKSLRKGDVVTTWDSNVILVLLPKMEYKQIIAIMDRIIKQFNKDNTDNDIKVKIHTALPPSD
ncbi:MAG: response regulator receiver protein [Thermoanaerobacteraceae bacterium]|nr:response regulator receiver protein [Thermoanaerobacteraceae bacterium]